MVVEIKVEMVLEYLRKLKSSPPRGHPCARFVSEQQHIYVGGYRYSNRNNIRTNFYSEWFRNQPLTPRNINLCSTSRKLHAADRFMVT